VASYLDRILEAHRAAAEHDDRRLDDLIEMARQQPPARGFLAALREASTRELAVIAEVVDDGEQLLGRNDDRYFEINGRFHTAIARAAGNLVLAQIVESLTELYSTELHVVDPDRALEEVRATDHRDHVDILTAIRDRDGDRARRAMLRHLDTARARVGKRLSSEPARHSR